MVNAAINRREQHLLEDLLNPEKYNRRVRPVLRSEDPVIVNFGLVVREIENLVSSEQFKLTTTTTTTTTTTLFPTTFIVPI